MPVNYCYTTPAEKARNFPRVIIPQIFALAAQGEHVVTPWLAQNGIYNWTRGEDQLNALHQLLRSGQYATPSNMNCDPPQLVRVTINNGGDCDQWAAVALSALSALGYTAKLVTFGNSSDRYQHVAAMTWWSFRRYLLDANGDDNGMEFNEWPQFQIWESHSWPGRI